MRIALRLGSILGLLLPVAAQVNTATVSGIVTDATGGLVPGTAIQLKNQQTGASFTTASNDTGRYTFNFIPVGEYSLTASRTGFQSQERRGIQLSAGENVDLDLKLQVSSAVQQVEITADAPLVDTSTSDQHQTITTREVTELPTAKLDWTNLLKIQPGVDESGQ